MKFVIDRFEGQTAVIETDNEKIVRIEKSLLAPNCKEGDIYEIIYLQNETEQRRNEIQKMKDRLFHK